MSTATQAAVAKVTKPKKAAKVSHAKTVESEHLAFPVQAGPDYGLMPVASITVLDQVRTCFDESSLRELAEDIATRGILQPLTVRKDGDQYILVAGERRLRAAQLAKLETVPVLIANVSADDHAITQLAENIQREELNLAEEAKAIALLHEKFGNLSDVAKAVHKSVPWVSKRLAASRPELAWPARKLIEEASTEDLELILTVDKLCKIDHYEGMRLGEAVKRGDAGRATARSKLEEVKEIEAARQKAREEREAKENDPALMEKRAAERKAADERWKRDQEEQRQKWHVDPVRQMGNFWDWCSEHQEAGGSAWLATRDEAQLARLGDAIEQWFAAGQGMTVEQLASRLLVEYVKGWNNIDTPNDFEAAALSYALSMKRTTFDLAEFMDWYGGKIVRLCQEAEQ